jgi:hypothetical protein
MAITVIMVCRVDVADADDPAVYELLDWRNDVVYRERGERKHRPSPMPANPPQRRRCHDALPHLLFSARPLLCPPQAERETVAARQLYSIGAP